MPTLEGVKRPTGLYTGVGCLDSILPSRKGHLQVIHGGSFMNEFRIPPWMSLVEKQQID